MTDEQEKSELLDQFGANSTVQGIQSILGRVELLFLRKERTFYLQDQSIQRIANENSMLRAQISELNEQHSKEVQSLKTDIDMLKQKIVKITKQKSYRCTLLEGKAI